MSDEARFLAVLGIVLLVGLVFMAWYATRDNILSEKIQQIDHYLDGIDASRKLEAIEKAVVELQNLPGLRGISIVRARKRNPDADFPYQHPFYWAGFVMWGSPE